MVPTNSNRLDSVSSSRSRRRNRRKQLRAQETDNETEQPNEGKPKSSQKVVNQTKQKKRNFKKSSKGNMENRRIGRRKEMNVEKQRGSISSTASTASTASLTDTSTKSDGIETIPQHVQLLPDPISEEFKSRFVALDCEMVGIGEGGKQSALGRVSIVNWEGDVIFDTFVRVQEPVTDLRTFVSGLKLSDVDGSCPKTTMELEACIQHVETLLAGKVLVGHALKNDLRVLGLRHPWYDIRDTTKYDAFLKDAPTRDGLRLPRKLKDLTSEILGWEIQTAGEPHCSVVDAVAAMNLYKSVSSKWEKVMEYKKKKTDKILSMQQNLGN